VSTSYVAAADPCVVACQVDWATIRRERRRFASGVDWVAIQIPELPGSLRQPPAAAATVALCRSLAETDMAGVVAAAGILAGRGEGSTPAGDDYLIGALYAVRAWLDAETTERLAGEIVAAAAPRTTTLSAAWLRVAAAGRAIPAWGELLMALAADGGAGDVAGEPLRRVMARGHSSGSTSLAGFVEAGRACRELAT
jgi:Protein of unknown function (DUF2877)